MLSSNRNRAIAGLLVFIIFSVLIAFVAFRKEIFQLVFPLMNYIKENLLWGSIVYSVIYGVLSSLLVPIGFLTVIGGILFKPVFLNVLIATVGSQLGLIISLIAGKSLLRPHVLKLYESTPKVKAIDHALKNDGLKVTILLRLAPIFPFGVCSYILSGTSLSMNKIILGTAIGELPGLTIHSIIGSLIRDISDPESEQIPVRIQALTWLFAVVFTTSSLIIVGIIARKALRGVIDLETTEEELIFEPPGIELAALLSNNSNNDSPCNENLPILGEEPGMAVRVTTEHRENNYSPIEVNIIRSVVIIALTMLILGIPLIIISTPSVNPN